MDVEIDGEGHDGSNDVFRGDALGMPTLRFTPKQILAVDFFERLLDGVLAVASVR